MDVRNTLLLEYSHLSEGDTSAGQLCPMCRGGGTGEHSLSVSRNGAKLRWLCHRASCGWAGNSDSKGLGASWHAEGYTKVPTTKGVVGRQYYKSADKLPPELAESLTQRYHLNPYQLGWLGWDADVGRVALPVPNLTGDLLGCVLRSESGGKPKALAYVEENAVAIFRCHTSDRLIIVEDIYSAIRASEYMNAAAILGTHLNDERIDTLRKMRCNKVYLALDLDAFDKTIKYAVRFRPYLPMIPVKLGKDLKNHTPAELKEFFNDLH